LFKAKYVPEFEKLYPKVNVKFEAITDYEGEVKIRLNSKDYGDVLLIPTAVKPDQYASFFEPLGDQAELAKKYNYVANSSYGGKTYGLPTFATANGIVYNKKVWTAAGITTMPTTPDEFLADLGKIKSSTKAIPLYTNYAAGWALTSWNSYTGGILHNPDAVNQLADDDAPWTPGKDKYIEDSLLFDAVQQGYTEPDPTTTDWESSKGKLGSGQIATMPLGSWSIVQMQKAAKDPADIGYMAFPNAVDGKLYAVTAPDYFNAVNVNSKNKAAARAWIDWFSDKSDFADFNGGIAPAVGSTMPKTLGDFSKSGVELMELTPPPAGKESLVKDIDKQAEIGFDQGTYWQNLVDVARGAKKGSKQEIFDDLNKKWAQARKDVGG
jgi:raffinose/stachyose/melibiose transport system substrate-binding protein